MSLQLFYRWISSFPSGYIAQNDYSYFPFLFGGIGISMVVLTLFFVAPDYLYARKNNQYNMKN
jgi:hypothetical protein